jgi:hypothetical protein
VMSQDIVDSRTPGWGVFRNSSVGGFLFWPVSALGFAPGESDLISHGKGMSSERHEGKFLARRSRSWTSRLAQTERNAHFRDNSYLSWICDLQSDEPRWAMCPLCLDTSKSGQFGGPMHQRGGINEWSSQGPL